MDFSTKVITIEDYEEILSLWNSSEQIRRAMNAVDDTREGIERYLKRNPNTCFAAIDGDKIIGVIFAGHDGRRGIIHHMCVLEEDRRKGIATHLVAKVEEALKNEGIQKMFVLVFDDNYPANQFWNKHGYAVRNNLNYRNKNLNKMIPDGE